MEPADAFKLGFLTAMVGVPLRGMELMNLVGKFAKGDLAIAVDAQINGFRTHNAGTVENVLRVESVLAANGLPKPARPYTFTDWLTWSREAATSAGASLKSDSAAAAALLAGDYFGDLLAAIQLEGILVGLLGDAPGDRDLAAQVMGHAGYAERAANQLGLVLRHPALSAKAKPPLEAALATYRAFSATRATLSMTALHEALFKVRTEIKRQGPALASAF